MDIFSAYLSFLRALAPHVSWAAGSEGDPVWRLLVGSRQAQLLSIDALAASAGTAERRMARAAEAYVRDRNAALGDTAREVRRAAAQLGSAIHVAGGSGLLAWYPAPGLRHMKDLDLHLDDVAALAPLIEGCTRHGWSAEWLDGDQSCLLQRRRALSAEDASALAELFPDTVVAGGGAPEDTLYVEIKAAPRRGAPADVAGAAFAVLEAEIGHRAVRLKHVLDALLGCARASARPSRDVEGWLADAGFELATGAFLPRGEHAARHLEAIGRMVRPEHAP
jgi:hypothetical protein